MTDTPLATELVLKIMGVEGEDALLPMPVLVNLHRTQLRAPLEALCAIVGQLRVEEAGNPYQEELLDLQTQAIVNWTDQRWDALAKGEIFRNDARLADMDMGPAWDRWNEMDDESLLRAAGSPSPLAAKLILKAIESWESYETLYILHQLSWKDADPTAQLKVLEIELGLHHAVPEILQEFCPRLRETWATHG
jgi:hypothetical protein